MEQKATEMDVGALANEDASAPTTSLAGESVHEYSGAQISQSTRPLLFFLNHPAHYHLFKNAINRFIQKGYPVKVIIVTKDILADLVKKEGWDYINLFPQGRRYKGLPIVLGSLLALMRTEVKLFKLVKRMNPAVMVGTEGTIAHTGALLKIPSLLFNEDDTKALPENHMFYPFATNVVLPQCCDPDEWMKKKITYPGYHELAYLHPNYFTPDPEAVKEFRPNGERYFILRLVHLNASHDMGKTGIDDQIARKVIALLEKHGKILVTSERPLKPEFEKYRIKIDPHDIFHALYYADLYIGDSQTMAAEAAVLGTPSVRFNDFVGRLRYLDELEYKYGLTFGIKTSQPQRLYEKIEELVTTKNLKEQCQKKAASMLSEKVDVVDFTVNVISKYL